MPEDIGARGMRVRTRPIFRAVIVIAWSSCTAASDPLTVASRTDAFEIGFGMSFSLDACGAPIEGDRFRKAIADKLDHCPLSAETKQHFQQRASALATNAKSSLDRYVTANGKLPDRLEGMKESCADFLRSDEYLRLRRLLQQYADGEITYESIITDRCDINAGAP
jgi:hypothetical protein